MENKCHTVCCSKPYIKYINETNVHIQNLRIYYSNKFPLEIEAG